VITKKTLGLLIEQKLKDAEILIVNRRYPAAIYIAGYALELALKLKICKIFNFVQGFPENKVEFNIYQNNYKHKKRLASTITELKDIRNHDLNKLLFYSGAEYQVKLLYFSEWSLVVSWDPEMRYKILKVLKKEALNKVNAIRTLIQNIL
jgi:hypothetical protein